MKVLMLSGNYLCVRAGKIAEAIPGIHHGLCRCAPPQMEDAYSSLTVLRCATPKEIGRAIASSGADIIHVHNTPDVPVSWAKEYTDAPVILNVHDVACAGVNAAFDPDEEAAYQDADAFVFVSEEQRRFAIDAGLSVEGKPYVALPNYASHTCIVDKSRLPHLGGVVYAGGVEPRGGKYRDLTPIADALGESFHLYPGNPVQGYECSQHPTVMEYRALTHRIAQHDWGLSGVMDPKPGWLHSYPNKVFEYFAAGIPLIALNSPLLLPFCEQGLGVYCTSIKEVKAAAKLDPKPFAKRVRAARERFTMSYNIGPLKEMYDRLRYQEP